MKTAMQELIDYTEQLKSSYDFSFDKFFTKASELLEKEKQQTEDFAISFAEWINLNAYKEGGSWETYTGKNNIYTIQELLEIYKKEKGL